MSVLQTELESLRAENVRLRAALAVVPPSKLMALALWLDHWDRAKLANAMGVTEAEVPDYMVSSGGDVQRDLRIMAALATAAEGEPT